MPFPFINSITTAIHQAIAKQMVSRRLDDLTTRQHSPTKLTGDRKDTSPRDEIDPWTPDNSYYAG